jgi:serine/threonine-protein kinase
MGVVLLARDVALDREVAVKLIAPGPADRAEAGARFRREAASIAAIRHNHVVQVYSFGAHDGSWFFAMEYVRGPSLESVLADHQRHGAFVPLHRALTVLLQVARGLAAAHASGIVHRDVKPANIVIEERTGRPVLVDFGLAFRLRPDGEDVIHGGTPAYMAPEQAGSLDISPATDVYGLACTAFDVLANRPPFDGETLMALFLQHSTASPPRLSSLRPELAPLDPVFARALAKQPTLRYASCGEMADALELAAAPWLVRPAAPDAGEETSNAEGPAVSVLVVDDDEDFRRFAARAAQLAFFRAPLRVTSVGSGAGALESAKRRLPSLVILDYDMPGLDGIATLSSLRALPGGTSARVLVVSAKAGAEERWKFGVLGVSDFLQKPVTLQALVDTIARAGAPRKAPRALLE